MRFFRREWNESRGDEFDAWGTAVYYFAVSRLDLVPTQQMEVYANGTVLKYTSRHPSDKYGMLSDQALELEDFAPFEISSEAFSRSWLTHNAINE